MSTYDLIILALEEIGKAVLLWKNSDNYRKEIKIKRDDWFFDHSPKLEAAFWFHRKGRDLKSLGINVNLQDFSKESNVKEKKAFMLIGMPKLANGSNRRNGLSIIVDLHTTPDHLTLSDLYLIWQDISYSMQR